MDGRGPAPLGGGAYVGGGCIYCAKIGARRKIHCQKRHNPNHSRGICGIGDAAYIARDLISAHIT